MRLVLVTGMSGSGKSIALNVLEDANYYCVDNLPLAQLPELVRNLGQEGQDQVAVASDVRSGDLRGLAETLSALKAQGHELTVLSLNARTEVLVQRFSETRRRHPLSLRSGQSEALPLTECIEAERELLMQVGQLGILMDTSDLKAADLRAWVRQTLELPAGGLSLFFQSFGFKEGIPLDADLVFDARCLPNPHYEPALKALTGLDKPVMDYFAQQPELAEMAQDISGFLRRWLPRYQQEQRSALTVAIGCTGGQHRSVYLVERLAQEFRAEMPVGLRHRSLIKHGRA